jgi:hypothetical protein
MIIFDLTIRQLATGTQMSLRRCAIPVPVPVVSVADPGSGPFLTQGSGILNNFFPDPGSYCIKFKYVNEILTKLKLLNIFKIRDEIIPDPQHCLLSCLILFVQRVGR